MKTHGSVRSHRLPISAGHSHQSVAVGRARRWWVRRLVATGLLVVATGCDDLTLVNLSTAPDTVTLYSIDVSTPNLVNGFDAASGVPVLVEGAAATGTWDFSIGTNAEGLTFVPPRVFGIDSKAAIAPMPGMSFDDISAAPQDTAAYVSDAALPIVVGDAWVVRTRSVLGYYGETCSLYAKVSALAVDSVRVRLVYLINPNCYDPRLVPG